MSLAASGGLGAGGGMGGAGGMMLAHQANAVGVPPAQPPPQANTTGATATPPSAAFLGADLLDKSQGLSLKNVKNVSHLPIVAIDLHGTEAHVVLFPKKPEDPSKGAPPIAVAAINTDVLCQTGETPHKTLRKYLGKSKVYTSLKAETITSNERSAVVVKKPHRLLGLRRLSDAPDFILTGMTLEEASDLAISEELPIGVGMCVSNSTLDGSVPTGDDFDRVVFKVRLHETKKALSMLPEEAVELIIRDAQYMVAEKVKADLNDDEIEEYPCAIALPAWACHDAAVEAMMEAMGNNGVLVQRNVAALAGSLLPFIDGRVTPVLERLNTVRVALHKAHQKLVVKEPDALFEDEVMLLIFGITEEGFEATSIQVSSANLNNISCLFGDYKVISNVSYQCKDPITQMQKCAIELEKSISQNAPEADGPAGIVFCGSTAEQKQMMEQWEKVKNVEWDKVPVFDSAVDCVAKGAAVLGAVSHGRLSLLSQTDGKKPRAELGIRVQNVAPVAVAIQMNYHGDAVDKWTPIKTIFDFDRQIPAGPHSIDLKAAECVVYRTHDADAISEEDFLKAVKQNEGAKGIPKREEAALNFRAKILQKWTRDGEWKQVGDVLEPLVKKEESKDGKVTRIACEQVNWELSLAVTGMISSSMSGERESVVVATKSARNSAIRYYLGLAFAILFFGGFLFKSYWDDFVLNRDTKRLLAYYKHVAPGSYQDGDLHNSRYTCYKYRNKKAKLWTNLEKKYGEPVLTFQEYEAMEPTKTTAKSTSDVDSDTVDLDEPDPGSDNSNQNEPDL